MKTESQLDMEKIFGTELECSQKLSQLWQEANILPHLPASTETVVLLLRAWGYDVNQGLLRNWCALEMVPQVATRGGSLLWSAINIMTAINQAESWRRWLPMHPRHVHKLNAVELIEQQALAEGKTAFTDVERFDTLAFVQMLATCDDENIRATLAVALKSKLRLLGVIDK